jgi:RHS repeat-associated protein
VTDVLGNHYSMTYTDRGELQQITCPGSVVETHGYDDDGNLATFGMTSHTQAFVTHGTDASGTVRATTLSYDAMGRVLGSRDAQGFKDLLITRYTGLGHMSSSIYQQFADKTTLGPATYTSSESQVSDALGNAVSSTTSTTFDTQIFDTWNEGVKTETYDAATGRILTDALPSGTHTFSYDSSGNTRWVQRENGAGLTDGVSAEDRVSFYDADNVLRATDFRHIDVAQSINTLLRHAFEEYSYDALGRRVMVRARIECLNEGPSEKVDCDESLMRRVVWDGSTILDEIQVPGGKNRTAAQLENDTQPDTLILDGASDDLNAYYGIVAYTYAGGLLGTDHPLSATRVNYVSHIFGEPITLHPPFSVVPVWNPHGQPDDATVADGTVANDGGLWECNPTGPPICTNGVQLGWPLGWFAFDRPRFVRPNWVGSLLEDQQDKGGTLYRRNRAYDPQSGRFTQEDPIGLAGGLNAYGFGGGDPITYSDPFGLCPPDWACQLAIELAVKHPKVANALGLAADALTYATKSTLKALPLLLPAEGAVAGELGETGEMSGMLREALAGKSNFGLGEATASQADVVGKAWVGEDAELASDGKTLVSKDGLRQYRPPSYKPKLGRVQANLEARLKPEGQWQSNAHIDIVP